jgi:hypothetical protein
MKTLVLALVVGCVCWTGNADAQTSSPPANPTKAEFSSPDHAVITRYDFGIFLLGATAPTSTVDIGKPAPRADGLIEGALNVKPFGIGNYELKVRAIVGTTVGPWMGGGAAGTATVPFDRVLLQPALLKVLP